MAQGIFFSSLFIDIITLIIFAIKKKFKKKSKIENKSTEKLKFFNISVIIPAFNEEQNIEKVIDSAFDQSVKPKQVIVVDDCSTDKTLEACKRAKRRYKNLKILTKKENKGKAHSISYVLKNMRLSEIAIVLDADTFLTNDYIKEIIKPFKDERVVIVTGMSFPIKPQNFFGRIIYHGAMFQYKFFCFRKKAHSLRNAIAVISGDSSAYRTSFLKSIGGFPQETVTEDMDITWTALEKGYKVNFQEKALARSKDPPTLGRHIKQISRWYSGSFQCIYKHGIRLWKAKPLLFTTLIPIYFDTILYAPLFVEALFLLPIYPAFSLGFYFADFIFTLIAILFLDWRWIRRLPEIYIIKFIWATIWLVSFIKTTAEYIAGKRDWSGGWSRDNLYIKEKKLKNV